MNEPMKLGEVFGRFGGVQLSGGACQRHGAYAIEEVIIGGVQRSTGCPSCRKEWEDQLRTSRQSISAKAELPIGVPARFSAARIDHIEMAPAMQKWMEALGRGATQGPLVICGPVGTGKTFTACALLYGIAEAGARGEYISAFEYGRRIRSTWNKSAEESETAILRKYSQLKTLVLDEVGATKDQDTLLVQELICARYDEDLLNRTIVVTNIVPAEFDQFLGTRAADRLREGATLVSLVGKSLRKPL